MPEGCPLPDHPGLRTQGRARPLPASTQGLAGLPRPQLSGEGYWSGGRYLGAVLQRLLQQQLVYSGHDAARQGRGLDGRAEGRRRGRRGCSGLRRPGRRSVPARAPAQPVATAPRRPSSQPCPPPSRINRKCGQRPAWPPEVWRPASAAPAARGEPQTLPAAEQLFQRLGCQHPRLRGRVLMPVSA